jgi:hypothetical protein
MGTQGLLGRYSAPRVADYGTLLEMTAAAHLLLGTTGVHDLSFSSPGTPGAGGESPGVSNGSFGDQVDPGSAGTLTATAGGGSPAGGTSSGSSGGSSGGSTGGGGSLPFTGLAVGAVTAAGSGLVAAGGALRRAVRSRRP